ncbi:MAG TPA: DUF5060 domain-containing protein [Candidatus Limnocylindrales bacterium]|nr:DUF5060 domain-containing protein [Candidatus Limnocylindrales bacterium]
MKNFLRGLLVLFIIGFLSSPLVAAPREVSFNVPRSTVESYDVFELSASVSSPDAANPFNDVSFEGDFSLPAAGKSWHVSGFCDSADGSTFRIRFMPSTPGAYTFVVVFTQGAFSKTFRGEFQATPAHRRGPLRVDPQYPWHFIWEGTGEHFFFNGTTAYWLLGWKEDRTVQYSLERLHRLKVNRLRVTLAGRTNVYYGEPIMQSDNFTLDLAAWPARDPHDFLHPDFDYSRFSIPHWRRFESMLQFARDRDMIISIVLDMNDSRIHPVAGSEDERRFLRYAVARFAAYSNVTWDLGDDLERFRDDAWTHDIGTFLVQLDPYHHLATSHPVDVVVDGKSVHQDRASAWFGFTSYQEWSRNQHALMLQSRKFQEATGRIIPQTNEEYGYEDHYPLWAIPGQESADSLRRVVWDIVMAGGYQTAGESARRGTNVWPDTGGGWVNGRGDDTMTMFVGYGHIVDFMTSFEWWKANPHDELVDRGNYCLADPGHTYAVYLPQGGRFTLQLQPGTYSVEWFSPLTGERFPGQDAAGPSWSSPSPPDSKEWALLLRKK